MSRDVDEAGAQWAMVDPLEGEVFVGRAVVLIGFRHRYGKGEQHRLTYPNYAKGIAFLFA